MGRHERAENHAHADPDATGSPSDEALPVETLSDEALRVDTLSDEAPAEGQVEAPAEGPVEALGPRRGRSGAAAVSVAQLRARLGESASPATPRAARRHAVDDDADADSEVDESPSPPPHRVVPARPATPDAGRRPPGRRGSHRPGSKRHGAGRGRRTRLLPLVAALFLLLLTTGAATATRIAFASNSSDAALGTSAASISAPSEDNRVSRDRRDLIDTVPVASGGVNAPIPSPTGSLGEPGSDPLAGAAEQNASVAPIETPTSTDPPPPPPPVWVRPTIGGNLTSCFCTRWGAFHDGIDIDPPLGTPILAVGDGVVVYAGPLSGYGVGIFIRHANGDVSFYGHESSSLVATGDTVTAGQQIARVGNEGYSTGPHLHFGVYQGWQSASAEGTAIDPIPWLRERGIEVGPYNPNG